ncbi:hypothetical protein EV361DRAFT_942276, partial [Lentinula raphanica]
MIDEAVNDSFLHFYIFFVMILLFFQDSWTEIFYWCFDISFFPFFSFIRNMGI